MRFSLHVGDAEGPKEYLQSFGCHSLAEAQQGVDKMYDELAEHPLTSEGTVLGEARARLALIGTMTHHYAYLLDGLGKVVAKNRLALRTSRWD